MLKSEKDFYHYFLYRFFLSDEEIDFFEIDNPLVLYFINVKRLLLKEIRNYNVHIISIGDHCLSKTISVMFGFSEFGLHKLPFDNISLSIEKIADIFKNKFKYFYANDILLDSENRKYYINSDYGLNFIHDHIFNDKDKEFNIKNFNRELQKRIENFYNDGNKNNTMFLMTITNLNIENIKYIYIIRDKLIEIFNNNKLFILNFSDIKLPNDIYHKNIIMPNHFSISNNNYVKDEYIWHKLDNYLSYEGISFFLNCAIEIMNFIKTHLEYSYCEKNYIKRSKTFYYSCYNYLKEKNCNNKKLLFLNEKAKQCDITTNE